MEERYTVILFPTSSHAIRAEKLVKGRGLTGRLVPVPRHLSSDCGLCLRVSFMERAQAISAVEEGGLSPEGVHDL